jgi:hypothetical protein
LILLTFKPKNDIINAKKFSFLAKILTFGADEMYKMSNPQKTLFTMFDLSKIVIENSNNRWVILSKIIPWEKLEERYARNFKPKGGRRGPVRKMRIYNAKEIFLTIPTFLTTLRYV